MLDPSIQYTPKHFLRPSTVNLDRLAAGRRASARHGAAFAIGPPAEGLHSWDLKLRLEAQGRDILIKETEQDLHDAVCAFCARHFRY